MRTASACEQVRILRPAEAARRSAWRRRRWDAPQGIMDFEFTLYAPDPPHGPNLAGAHATTKEAGGARHASQDAPYRGNSTHALLDRRRRQGRSNSGIVKCRPCRVESIPGQLACAYGHHGLCGVIASMAPLVATLYTFETVITRTKTHHGHADTSSIISHCQTFGNAGLNSCRNFWQRTVGCGRDAR